MTEEGDVWESVDIVDTRLEFFWKKKNEPEYNSAACALLSHRITSETGTHCVSALQTLRFEIIISWKYPRSLLRFRTLWGSKTESYDYIRADEERVEYLQSRASSCRSLLESMCDIEPRSCTSSIRISYHRSLFYTVSRVPSVTNLETNRQITIPTRGRHVIQK